MENNIAKAHSAFIISVIFSLVLVISKEMNQAIKDMLKNTFYHHWLGHGILTLVVFGLVYYTFPSKSFGTWNRKMAFTSLLFSIIGLMFFYSFHIHFED